MESITEPNSVGAIPVRQIAVIVERQRMTKKTKDINCSRAGKSHADHG
jgi:hypothetical protein